MAREFLVQTANDFSIASPMSDPYFAVQAAWDEKYYFNEKEKNLFYLSYSYIISMT